MKGLFFLPTMGRPERLREVIRACVETGMTARGVIILNGADQREAYSDVLSYASAAGWDHAVLPENLGFNGAMQWALETYPDLDWYGCMADDCAPRTPGWDRALLAALSPETRIVSANDLWQSPRRLGVTSVFDGELLRAMGFWMLPGLWSCYADDVIEGIGRDFGIWRTLMDVVAEHAHVLNRKAPNDATYAASYGDPERIAADKRRYLQWRRDERASVYARITALLGHPDEAAARLARLKERRPMICTPVYRDPAWQYTLAFASTLIEFERLGLRHVERFRIGGSNLPRTRNELVAEFLASDCTDLLFIDADMGWKVNDVLRLLASDKDVIGGVGRKRCDKPNDDPDVWCVRLIPGSEHCLTQDAMGAIEVRGLGTGFLKITRPALETMIAHYPQLKAKSRGNVSPEAEAHYYRLFRFGLDGDEADDSGEDFVFCSRWRAIGGSVWFDPTIELVHAGDAEFRGRFADLLQMAPLAQAAE